MAVKQWVLLPKTARSLAVKGHAFVYLPWFYVLGKY
jgi:hypothetical protein